MIQDIVCGMYLITAEGCKLSEVNGEKYYFCCDICKEEFDKNTEKYVENYKPSVAANKTSEHIEWERDPVCGERIKVSEAKGITLYKKSRYYFCCKICKKVFDSNPAIYADKEEGFYDSKEPNELVDGIFRIL